MRVTTLFTLLKRRFPAKSEKELYAFVLCGEVLLNGERCRDPRRPCTENDRIEIKADDGFVSRGGDKLEGALAAFRLDCRGKTFIDCGASTGGFTDCLLRHGAAKVYAIDVGYAQFDFRLRGDPRIELRERTNIMDVTRDSFPEPPQAAVIDLSFRSLRRAAAHVLGLVSGDAAVALVKPQFEWLDPPAGYDGIVREKECRRGILLRLAADLEGEGLSVRDAIASTLPGAKGNIEYFFLLSQHFGAKGRPAAEIVAALFRDR
jgi:23S rRNA (cytidine1920-2'-O)/16S rRNA (cytidine1409-2'-O)-methyltransferase